MDNGKTLIESAAPAVKFGAIGDTATLTVTNVTERDAQSIEGRPLTNDSGQPVKEWVIVGVTADGDEVRIFAKRQMRGEILRAVTASGCRHLEDILGTLTVTFASEKPSATPGYSPQKIFAARYAAPIAAPAPAAPAPGLAASLI